MEAGPNAKIHFRLGERYSQFWLGNEVFLPSIAGRINGMDSRNWGLCSRHW